MRAIIPMPLISLCTWVRDWPPLRQTLPRNLATIAGHDAEICVTDLGSIDGTRRWLGTLAARNAQLRWFAHRMDRLHFARAYNLAFSFGRGAIVCCLDADNIIGPRWLDFCAETIRDNPRAFIHGFLGDWLDGTAGRMAMHRDLFAALGGYDESLGPCGFQDLDLRNRAQALGATYVLTQDPEIVGTAIRTERKKALQHLPGVDYGWTNSSNAALSAANIAAGRLRANQSP